MRVKEMGIDINEGLYDLDPKTMQYVKMGQKISSAIEPSSGIKWPDDAQWNKAAALGSALSSMGSSFAVKTVADALKQANVTPDEAKEIIQKVKAEGKGIKPGQGVKDPEPNPDDEEDKD